MAEQQLIQGEPVCSITELQVANSSYWSQSTLIIGKATEYFMTLWAAAHVADAGLNQATGFSLISILYPNFISTQELTLAGVIASGGLLGVLMARVSKLSHENLVRRYQDQEAYRNAQLVN